MVTNFPASLPLSCRIVLSKIKVSLSQPLLCRDCQSEKLHRCSATKGKTAYRRGHTEHRAEDRRDGPTGDFRWLGSLNHTCSLLLGFAV